MKIAYMPDTHFGSYDQAIEPKSSEVADAMQHCLDEAVLAERVGLMESGFLSGIKEKKPGGPIPLLYWLH